MTKKLPQDLLNALETIAQYFPSEKVATDLVTHYFIGRNSSTFYAKIVKEELDLESVVLQAGYDFGEKYRSEIPVEQLDRSLPSKSLDR